MPPVLLNILVSFAAFGLMAKLSPCNSTPRPFVSRDLADNTLYWAFGVFFMSDLSTLFVRGGAAALFGPGGPAAAASMLRGYGPASTLPLIVQAALVIVAMDFVQYWLHRLFHTRWLWPFHAIHHSAEDLDWSATYRIHPVNLALYGAGALAVIHVLGFSGAAFLILGPFNLVVGALVHANLDWTFGPFRYVFASPVYHRWHHARDPAHYDRNFAPTFPVFDIVFGTYDMPKGELPQAYGVEGAPRHFLGQLVWPFVTVFQQALALVRPRASALGT